jgi:hypothetical protein
MAMDSKTCQQNVQMVSLVLLGLQWVVECRPWFLEIISSIKSMRYTWDAWHGQEILMDFLTMNQKILQKKILKLRLEGRY